MLLVTSLALALTLGSNAYPINTSTIHTGAWGPGSGPSANPGSVYLCRDPNWGGECTYLQNPLIGTLAGPPCNTIPDEWQQIRSIGGDEGPECFSFANGGCEGVAIDVSFPGVPDVEKMVQWRDWTGQVMSYRCYFKYNPENDLP